MTTELSIWGYQQSNSQYNEVGVKSSVILLKYKQLDQILVNYQSHKWKQVI